MADTTATYLLDELGRPYRVRDLVAWALGYSELLETGGTIVAHDEIGETVVSTVFLGIDSSNGLGSLQLFETATFEPMEVRGRWATREQALAGHASVCIAVRAWSSANEELAARRAARRA